MTRKLCERDEVLEHINSCPDVKIYKNSGYEVCWVCDRRYPWKGVYRVDCKHVLEGFGICDECLKTYTTTATKEDFKKYMHEFVQRIKDHG